MFINNIKLRNNVTNVNVECCGDGGGGGGGGINFRKIIHITEPTYTINILPIELLVYSPILYIADVQTTIYLPSLDDNIINLQLEILNNSGANVTINSVDDDVLYNSLYMPNGSPTFMLTKNKYCRLISRKQINLFSWILLTS